MASARKPKILALVQARMSSTRLPGKVLTDLCGVPVLGHVCARARAARTVDQVAVATSTSPADDAIEAFCRARGIAVYRGPESDVLDRFAGAAEAFGADAVVRITADCPLMDPAVIDRVVSAYLEGACDYASNILICTYPDGLDVEAFSAEALRSAAREAKLPAEREHVTPFIRNPKRFRLVNVPAEEGAQLQHHRWTLDTPEDLAFIRGVFAALGSSDRIFGAQEVLALLERSPKLQRINQNMIRNDGFYKGLAQEPPMPPRTRKLDASLALKKRAERLIPSCSQTFSKGPTQFVQGVAPVFLSCGKGCRVWDVDGNEYIDYPMALGPIILGHAYPAVNEAAARQLAEGVAFSLPHPLEVEVAELLCSMIPGAGMARFGKNGSDVTAGAVRAARAWTGREIVACCGYHGWQDWYIGTTTRNRGVPGAVRELTLAFEYNKIETLQRIFEQNPGKVAAVIMEPVGVVPPREGFLAEVKSLAAKHGALLIFDEVVTGFRLANGGAQQHFGVTPDLSCFGKAMGNGFPIAAVVGRPDLMEIFDTIFFSFTFGGEAVSLAAAAATLGELRSKPVIPYLWELGQQLKDGYNVLAREFGLAQVTECMGLAPRTVTVFRNEDGSESLERKSLFQQECLKRGVLFSGGHNICFSHGHDDILHTLRAYRTAMEILAQAVRKGDVAARLEGPPVQAVFRKA